MFNPPWPSTNLNHHLPTATVSKTNILQSPETTKNKMELKRKADSVSTSSDSSSSSSSPSLTNSPQPSLLPSPTSTGLDSTASPPKKIKIIIKQSKPKMEMPMVDESPICGMGPPPIFSQVEWVESGTGTGASGTMGGGGCRSGLEEVSPRSMTFCRG